MHILIHDFAGHPFQIQLSRELAARGHSVLHVYPDGLPGPKGAIRRRSADPSLFRIEALPLPRYFRKYSPSRRLVAQVGYADSLRHLVEQEQPDVVLSGNTPIDVQYGLLRCCHKYDIGFVHWVQDVYYEALRYVLQRSLGRWLAEFCVMPFWGLEKAVVHGSDQIVVIGQAFGEALERIGAPTTRINVVENWAPLDEICLVERDCAWCQSLNLDDRPIFLYAGTLGLKHRPELLYSLASALGGQGQVVVISEGVGRDYLGNMPKLENLKLLDFQPYDHLPRLLASADVLLATLESDAGRFAVPSKVLTYLCVGRPVLLAAPKSNLAVEVLQRSGGGLAVDPLDTEDWIRAALELATSREKRLKMGARARSYAEKAFNIHGIAETFEQILAAALRNGKHLQTRLPGD